jgi:GNAT superfamily N-acetyltransferase
MRSTPCAASRALAFVLKGKYCLLDGDVMVGLCALSFAPERDWAFIEMTGILRPYRRRGLATALKRYAIEQARSWGPPRFARCTIARIVRSSRPTSSSVFAEAEFDLV